MTETEARKRSKQMLARMEGVGWEALVWDSCEGWRYAARNGSLHVQAYPQRRKTTYVAFLSDGHVKGQGYADPNEAVRQTIKEARKVVNSLNRAVKKAESIVKGSVDGAD